MTKTDDMDSPTRALTLLLVEDDDGDAKAVERAFKQVKIKNSIVRAIDGVEALEMLRGENGHIKIEPPYMLLVDINKPRMNGIEFVEALRKDPALKQSLVFMLTTSKIEEDKVAA